jgi:hypothetical protein
MQQNALPRIIHEIWNILSIIDPISLKTQGEVLLRNRLFKNFCVNDLFSFLDERRGFRSPKETPMLILLDSRFYSLMQTSGAGLER